MMKNTVIRQEFNNGLSAREWRFWFDDGALILDSFVEYGRASKRHKFQPQREYQRLGGRSIFRAHVSIEESEVPFDESLRAQALDEFVSGLRVVRWSEVKK